MIEMMRSLFAGVSGLRNHQTRMDVIGNNISNVNTMAFKRSRVNFQEMLVQTLRGSSAPQSGRGGTNPIQVGLGVNTGSIDALFTQGSLQSTGKVTDLAIQGDGFFVLTSDGTDRFYTRAGNFDLDRDGNLIDKSTGFKVLGYLADASGNINSSSGLTSLSVQVGRTYPPTPTSSINFGGNLNAGAAIGTAQETTIDVYDGQGTIHRIITTYTKSVNNEWTYSTALDRTDGLIASYLTTYYPNFDTMTATDQALVLDQAQDVFLGGKASASGIGASSGPGVHIEAKATGAAGNSYRIELVAGAATDATIAGNDITVTLAAGATLTDVVNAINNKAGVGQLPGDPITATFDATANGSTVAVAEAWTTLANGSNSSRTGKVIFNTNGLVDSTATRAANVGAISPNLTNAFSFQPVGTSAVQIVPDVKDLTQYNAGFTAIAKKQNGNPSGTLQSISISKNGSVSGVFSNGFTLDLGAIGLAVFNNPAGLFRLGDNLYKESNNSGTSQAGLADSGGRGSVVPGTLEMSNVDLAQEFTDMIITQRGFQANTRVITTSDELLQELANLKR